MKYLYLTIIIIGIITIFSFKISKINCTTQFGPCSDRQYSQLNKFIGKRLISKFEIKDGQISKRLPDTLDIRLNLRPPDFKIGENLIVVNKEVYTAEYNPPILKFKISDSLVMLDLNHLPTNWQQSLQKLLTQSKISGKVPKVIDLRFAQPVLTY